MLAVFYWYNEVVSFNLGNQIKKRLQSKIEVSKGKLLSNTPLPLQRYLSSYNVIGVYEIMNFGNRHYGYCVVYLQEEKTTHQMFYLLDRDVEKGEIIDV